MEMHGASKQLVQGLDDKINNSSTGLVKNKQTNKLVILYLSEITRVVSID